MSKIRKILTLAACAVLLVCVTVAGTVAYLTSQDSIKNTFTVGNVTIKLDESKVNANGEAIGNERTEEGNTYKVFPGGTYTKDPTVTVLANSEESFVYMAVKPSDLDGIKTAFPAEKYPTYYNNGIFLLQMLVDWNTDWQFVTFENDTYIFMYKETVDTLGGAELKMDSLFTTITLPEEMTNTELAELHELDINVAAFAIQADGMDADSSLQQAKPAFVEIFSKM